LLGGRPSKAVTGKLLRRAASLEALNHTIQRSRGALLYACLSAQRRMIRAGNGVDSRCQSAYSGSKALQTSATSVAGRCRGTSEVRFAWQGPTIANRHARLDRCAFCCRRGMRAGKIWRWLYQKKYVAAQLPVAWR
jgi:hypothetical protein